MSPIDLILDFVAFVGWASVGLYSIFRRRLMGACTIVLIHDAVWVEPPAGEEKEARRLMDKIMSTAGRPFLEMKVDFSD